MKPFLLIAIRPEDLVAAQEYAAIRRFGGLAASELVHLRLDQSPLPELNLSDYSGIIIGGSPFNVSDDAVAKTPTQVRVERDLDALLGQVIAQDFPLLGLCYGLGVLGVHLGAHVDHQFGEPAGAVAIQLTPAGQIDPLLQGMSQNFYALTGHKEAISSLTVSASSRIQKMPGADKELNIELLASSLTAPIQMLKVGQNVYAVQFHPELDVPGILERLSVYSNNGYFQPGEFDATVNKIKSQPVIQSHQIIKNFVTQYAK